MKKTNARVKFWSSRSPNRLKAEVDIENLLVREVGRTDAARVAQKIWGIVNNGVALELFDFED